MTDYASAADWVASMPEELQVLAREFPPGAMLQREDREYFVSGYCDDGRLMLTSCLPDEPGYRDAFDRRMYVPVELVRQWQQGALKCPNSSA